MIKKSEVVKFIEDLKYSMDSNLSYILEISQMHDNHKEFIQEKFEDIRVVVDMFLEENDLVDPSTGPNDYPKDHLVDCDGEYECSCVSCIGSGYL